MDIEVYLEASCYKEYCCVVHLEFIFYSLIVQKLQDTVGQNLRAELRTSLPSTPNHTVNSSKFRFVSGPKYVKSKFLLSFTREAILITLRETLL